MPTAWSYGVRAGKKLSVFATPSAESGYGRPIQQAITWFNQQKMGVTLVRAQAEKDCHIRIEARDGTVTGGSQQDEIQKDVVNGLYFRDGDKAWIYVPLTPKVQAAVRQAHGDILRIPRLAGDPVKMFMIAHELLHCAGLDQEDHTPPQHGDVFTGEGNWVPEAGASAAHDQMNLSGQVGFQMRQPPLSLHPSTKTKLMTVWG